MQIFAGNMLWQLLIQSDGMTKMVMLTLLGASIISWSVAIYKLLIIRAKTAQLKAVVNDVRHMQSFEALKLYTGQKKEQYAALLLLDHCAGAQRFFNQRGEQILSSYERDTIQEERFMLIDELVQEEHAYLPVVSVTFAVAPLLGLFGTVWGLTHSFLSISQKQTADIVTIAPGMAEALLTTIAGLLVAIPVLILYHMV